MLSFCLSVLVEEVFADIFESVLQVRNCGECLADRLDLLGAIHSAPPSLHAHCSNSRMSFSRSVCLPLPCNGSMFKLPRYQNSTILFSGIVADVIKTRA